MAHKEVVEESGGQTEIWMRRIQRELVGDGSLSPGIRGGRVSGVRVGLRWRWPALGRLFVWEGGSKGGETERYVLIFEQH